MSLEHPPPVRPPAAFTPGCPRAGYGCARDGIPPSAAAGWDLVQRDWGLRLHEPGPPRALQRAGMLVMRIVRAVVRVLAARLVRARALAVRQR